jgi:hypothetical protein
MKHFKKIMRLSFLVFIMVLASVGMGLSGPFPVSMNKRREDDNEIKIELVEIKKEKKADTKLGEKG